MLNLVGNHYGRPTPSHTGYGVYGLAFRGAEPFQAPRLVVLRMVYIQRECPSWQGQNPSKQLDRPRLSVQKIKRH